MRFLSWLYGIIICIRTWLYKKNIFKTKKIEEAEIICIGNITAGGTGKTPAVQYFAKKYIKEGRKVMVVSRGYGGKRKEDVLIVSDGKKIFASPKECGDEPYLHAITLPCPIIVAKDRYNACKKGVLEFKSDLIILDDGYQHLKLKRDKNIVLIDANNPFGNDKILPLGRLREPIDGLKRADEFIITKSDMVSKEKTDEITKRLAIYGKPVKKSIHKPKYFYDTRDNIINFSQIEKYKKILLLSGLANPQTFEKTVKEFYKGEIVRIDYKDHYFFTEKDIEKIKNKMEENGAEIIITTEKDFVKLKNIIKEKIKLLVLKIEFEIKEEESV